MRKFVGAMLIVVITGTFVLFVKTATAQQPYGHPQPEAYTSPAQYGNGAPVVVYNYHIIAVPQSASTMPKWTDLARDMRELKRGQYHDSPHRHGRPPPRSRGGHYGYR